MGKKTKNSGAKRLQQETRERKARHKRTQKQMRRLLVVSVLVLIIVLFAYDQSGPVEVVDAQVTDTETWPHVGQQPPHSHTRATLSILEQTEITLDRADGFVTGQSVPVKIKRGRLTGWVTYQDLVTPIGQQ